MSTGGCRQEGGQEDVDRRVRTGGRRQEDVDRGGQTSATNSAQLSSQWVTSGI